MKEHKEHQKPIVIIGAGITGLAAAWELQKNGVPYLLLEESKRVGGKVNTHYTEDGFLIEQAADAFIIGKPWALELAKEIGLEDEITHPREETKKLYFLKDGELLDFPTQLKMFVPLEDESFLKSGVLSHEGLQRMLNEQHIPAKENTEEDESLGDFIRRRFGKEAMNFIVPMAAGIYVADPDELSMKATFPQFLAMEQAYGSLTRGSRALPVNNVPIFASFRGGMDTLAKAIAEKLTDLRLKTSVLFVKNNCVITTEGAIEARAVLLALPSWKTQPLLAEEYPEAANLVGELGTNGSVAVVLAYRAADFSRDMAMHGLLVSADEGIPLKAMTVHSSKMHGRAPDGHVLIRVFFGDLDPEKAIPEAKREVARLLGVKAEALWHRVADWRGKNPAYRVGHLEHLERIRAALPTHIRVAGASYTGVGIPDCVRAGRETARQLMHLEDIHLKST